jgi:hypothetical protein
MQNLNVSIKTDLYALYTIQTGRFKIWKSFENSLLLSE